MLSDKFGCSPLTALSQFAVSLICYAGAAVVSIWDEDVRADMDRISWNPFNSDESLVLESSAVSFYKGQFVVRENWEFTNGRSGSFYIMFLNSNETSADAVRHEWGHFVQLGIMGVSNYIPTVAIPSILSDGQEDYYSLPWERTADYLGGVDRGNYRDGSLLWGMSQFVLGPSSVPLYGLFG